MSPTDRLSDRVVETNADRQVNATEGATKGADGSSSRALPSRVGPAAIARVRNRLSQRDHEILGTLRELHYLTSTQIERLHFTGHASSHAAARASRRVLRRLHDDGLLHRLERRIGGVRAGSASCVYGLSSLGHRLVGTTSRRRSREPSLAHLQHVLAAAEVVVQVSEAVRDQPQLELVAVSGEPGCWRHFTAAHGGAGLLKPDLRLIIRRGEHDLHWFVEVDRGSEHRPVLVRKLRTYVEAWRDGGEQAEHGVFPRVLWSVPEPDRSAVLLDLIAKDHRLPDGMFVVCTSNQAAEVLMGGSS